MDQITRIQHVYLGVAENRGPYYSTLNSRILILGPQNRVPLIFGNSHLLRGSTLGEVEVGGSKPSHALKPLNTKPKA